MSPERGTSGRKAGRQREGGAPLRAAVCRNAEAHARDLAPVVDELLLQGVKSLRGIASAQTIAACSPGAAGGGMCRTLGTCWPGPVRGRPATT
jgi:hypothetical protein